MLEQPMTAITLSERSLYYGLLQGKLLLVLGAIVMFVSSASAVGVSYGHGVCAMMSCDAMKPCYPLTIIKECGVTVPPILIISVIASSAGAMIFVLDGRLEQNRRRGAISNFFSLKHGRP
jgi:hypothetical protein